jgi:hypothetical protein
MRLPFDAQPGPLEQAAGLHGQIIQCHLEFRDGGADFWMFSDFFLQRLQNLARICDMRRGLGCILLGLRFGWLCQC